MLNGFVTHVGSVVAVYEIDYLSHLIVRLLSILTSLGVLRFVGLRVGILATMRACRRPCVCEYGRFVAYTGVCVQAIDEFGVLLVKCFDELDRCRLQVGIIGASFCEIAHLAASAAKSSSCRAVFGYVPPPDRAASAALPYVIHEVTGCRAGGTLLDAV